MPVSHSIYFQCPLSNLLANPSNQVRGLQQRAMLPQKKLCGTYPSYNSTAPDRFQGARQAEYPPVSLSELHHFTVQVLQANTVTPLDRRKTLIKSWNQLQPVDNPQLIPGNSFQARATLPQSLSHSSDATANKLLPFSCSVTQKALTQ